MSTAVLPVGSSWTLVSSGPLDSVSIQANSVMIKYVIAATIPSNNRSQGHTLPPFKGNCIVLSSGENLYARTSTDSSATELMVTT